MPYAFVFFAPKNLGEGQFYFFAIKDKDSNDLERRNTYRLKIPADAPVRQYWSVVAYDRATHGLICNMPSSSRVSNMPDLQRNADGSVDVWFDLTTTGLPPRLLRVRNRTGFRRKQTVASSRPKLFNIIYIMRIYKSDPKAILFLPHTVLE